MQAIESDWKELETELTSFQKKHIEYVKKLEEVEQMKKDYLVKYLRYSKKLKSIDGSIKKLQHKIKTNRSDSSNSLINEGETKNVEDDDDDTIKTKINLIKNKIDENMSYMTHISDTFPRPNG
jgi:hypothetical protein